MNKGFYTVPTEMTNFKTETYGNNYVSRGQLKIFSVGSTGDNRVFTKEFSDKLLKTLPYTPVVGFFDEDDDDFKGHNHTQYVYGFVPHDSEIKYSVEKDANGKEIEWAITDVILFTGREDNIGEVASKIEGKSHSLELDPNTLKYNLIVNEQNAIQRIVFTEGSFVGLSVLGDDERPAFTGSHFFSEAMDKIKEFKNQFFNTGGMELKDIIFKLLSGDFSLTEEEKATLNENKFKTLNEAVTEIENKFYEAYPSTWIFNYESDFSVVYFYDYDADANFKMGISNVDGNVEFYGKEEVFVKYLTKAQIEKAFAAENNTNFAAEDAVSTEEVIEEITTEETEEVTEEVTEEAVEEVPAEEFVAIEEENTEDAPTEDKGEFADATEATEQEEEVQETEDVQVTEPDSLSSEDREELNNYRKQEKFSLITKFKKFLNKEQIEDFTNKIDDFTVLEMKAELSMIVAEKAAEEPEEEVHGNTNFANIIQAKNITEQPQSTKAALVNKYK